MKNRKLLSFLAALALVFSALGFVFTPSATAATNIGQYLEGTAIPPDPNDPNCSTVVLSREPVSGDTIGVTFIIETGDAYDEDEYEPIENTHFRKEVIDVPVSSPAGTAITVTTLLNTLNNTNGLQFFKKSGTGYPPIDASTDYLASVKNTFGNVTNTWTEGILGFDGFEFRINDKFPVQLTADGGGYEGQSILQTYLADGDVVHFVDDFPYILGGAGGDDYAANYVRGVYESYAGGILTVQLQGHKTNIHGSGSTAIMDVNDYVNLGAGVAAGLFQADGVTQVGSLVLSKSNGDVVFTNVALTPGSTYILKTAPTYHVYDGGYDGMFFDLTGGYTKIEIPPAQ